MNSFTEIGICGTLSEMKNHATSRLKGSFLDCHKKSLFQDFMQKAKQLIEKH